MQPCPFLRAQHLRDHSTTTRPRRPRSDGPGRGNTATREAGRTHHPLVRPARDARRLAPVCIWCGFEPPARAQAAAELRSLAARWESLTRTDDPIVHERAAQLSDELHVVANRVERLLDTPGSELPPVRLQPPISRAGTPREMSVARIRVAAARLSDLVAGLTSTAWGISGAVGGSPTTIGELVAAPLHSSHRFLEHRDAARPMIETVDVAAPDGRAGPVVPVALAT
jgi:hypothetical protein